MWRVNAQYLWRIRRGAGPGVDAGRRDHACTRRGVARAPWRDPTTVYGRVRGRTHSYVMYDGSAEGGPKITVTNPDIRAIQMAKAALYSGARLLMDKFGVDKVDRVVLAGAFGAHISPKHALVLGMIPDVPFDRVTSAGNAAGSGARIALIDTAQRAAIEQTVRQIEKIETAIEPPAL